MCIFEDSAELVILIFVFLLILSFSIELIKTKGYSPIEHLSVPYSSFKPGNPALQWSFSVHVRKGKKEAAQKDADLQVVGQWGGSEHWEHPLE